MTVSNLIRVLFVKNYLETLKPQALYQRLQINQDCVFFFSFHNLHRYKWQYRGVYHERGRGRQLALATWKSPNLSANVWVSICRSNQSGSKIIFSAEFEVFNGFNNLEQNRCLTINSCMEETGLIYNEN